MSARLLPGNFDGTMERLALRVQGEETQASFHTRFWDGEDKLTEAVLEFSEVAAVSFAVNYFDNPLGAELFGLYEILDEAEKARLVRENFEKRRRSFLLAGYDGYDPKDPHDLLNNTEELDRILEALEDYHLYEQQTQGGTYRLLAKSCAVKRKEESHGSVGLGAGTVE